MNYCERLVDTWEVEERQLRDQARDLTLAADRLAQCRYALIRAVERTAAESAPAKGGE